MAKTKILGSQINLKTSVGSPGSHDEVPSEAAIRAAINDMTNVAARVHALTSKSTPVDDDETLLVDSAASYAAKRLTWSSIKAALKSYFDSLYAPSSKGVTNGDSHDHYGGDGAQIDHGSLGGLGDDDHPQYLKESEYTAKGDILTASGASSVVRIPAPSDGSTIIADSSQSSGWTTGDHGALGGLNDDDHKQYALRGIARMAMGMGLPVTLNLASVDADLKGFRGGFTDGRYGYFVPYYNGSYFGKVARVDLMNFTTGGVTVLDLASVDPDLKGFYGGFTDGRYGYFVPYNNGSSFGKAVRIQILWGGNL